MLSSKQRAKLRGLASTIDSSTILGKDGLTNTVLEQIKNQLFAREIVKVTVLESAPGQAKDYLHEAAQKLGATEVCSIGRKFALYKMSNKKGIKHIELN